MCPIRPADAEQARRYHVNLELFSHRPQQSRDGFGFLKLVAEEPLLFRVVLEVARMPVWKEWFFKDEAGLLDALFAHHQFWTAAKNGASFWTVRVTWLRKEQPSGKKLAEPDTA